MRMRHRRAHRRIWGVFALVLPALFLATLLLRPGLPREEAPMRIAPPTAPR